MALDVVGKVKKLFSRGEDSTARSSSTRNEEFNRLYDLTKSDPFQALLNDYLYAGKRRTTNFLEMYKTAIRYTYGDQIHQERQSGWEYPIINILFPTLMQEVGFLAAENPRVTAEPTENTDKEIAEAASGVLNGHWSKTLNMQMKIQQALIDGHLAGWYVGFGRWNPKKTWSKEQQRWIGEIDFNIVNPRYFGCDEECELAADIPQKANFILFDYYMDKRQAIKDFPFYRHWLETEKHEVIDEYWIPGGSDSGDPVSTSQSHTERFDASLDWIGPDQIAKNKELLQQRLADILCGDAPGNRPGERHVRIQMMLYRHQQDEKVEDEYRPFTPEEIRAGESLNDYLGWDEGTNGYTDLRQPQIDGDGEYNNQYAGWDPKNEMPKKKVRDGYERPRYPTGRWTVRLDDEVIVEDKPFPYERWPVAVGVNYLLPHVWQGLNSIEMGLNLQDYYNDLYTHILNNVRHHSDTQWVVETDALEKDRNNPEESVAYVPNASGSIIRVNVGKKDAIRREPPASMPNWIEQLDPMLYRRFQDLQGMQDPAMGKGSSEQKTFRGLRMLNQNTQIRIGLQEKSLHVFLTQAGYTFTELMAVHYEPDRWVRHLGPTRESAMVSMQWDKEKMTTAKYDLEIVAHSTLPYDEQEEKGLYMKLAELMGQPMYETMLEKLGIEEVDEILMKDALLGPLTQLLELAQENNLPPEAIMQAIQAQLELLTRQLQPAAQQP